MTEFSSIATHVQYSPPHASQDNSSLEEKCQSPSPSHRRGHYYVNVSPRAPVMHKGNTAVKRLTAEKKKTLSQGYSASPNCSPQHNKIPPPKLASKAKCSPEEEECNSNPFNALIQDGHKPEINRLQGMKHSFRYRKITLKKEKTNFW